MYRHLFDALHEQGVRQTVCSPRGVVPDSIRTANCEWIEKSIWGRRHRLLFGAKVARYERMVESSGFVPDQTTVVHAHTLFSDGFAARRVARRYGLPYVVAVRNTDINLFAKYFPHLRAEARQVLLEASAVIFLNRPYIQKLQSKLDVEIPEARIKQIPNGIDEFWHTNPPTDLWVGSLKRIRQSDDPIKIISIGLVDRSKNHSLLIEAVRMATGEGERKLSLTVIGSIDSAYGRKLANTNEAIDIRFTGRLPKEDVRQELSKHDVFALVSKRETFGLVYAEAISQGLPVIYTRGEGFDGWITDQDLGRACASDDAECVRQSAVELGTADSQALATRRQEFSARFKWRTVASEIRSCYASALEEKVP